MAYRTERLAPMELHLRRRVAPATREEPRTTVADTHLDWTRVGAWATAVVVSLAVWVGIVMAVLRVAG